MVDFTIADIVGGEPLFPGKFSPSKDREQRIDQLRKLFREAVDAMRRGDYVEAKACVDGIQFAFTVAKSVHDERQRKAEAGKAQDP